ncbi:flagellar basal body-associated FliL family protein [Salinarimonas soli]|uniref:Flagellar protein FliL n=1 Tax=Salinarimonas soli TaxID=1638099 RepID=A0A5B2VE70_9HYPH|nr:flagellar basal body-associated FliL family protein [Salinarimonas soli]KAA2237381.1 flagellar basal body-associated FliL family protein [Salinarimonas soli]
MAKALPAPVSAGPSGAQRAATVLILTGLAAATGAGVAYTLGDAKPPPRAVEAGAPGAGKAAETNSMVRLAPIVTNLARPTETWIRLEGSIVLDGVEGEKARVLAAEIGGDVLAYLRTLALSQIEGAGGLQSLREDLAERVRLRSNGRARELVIETLVVQ